MKKKMNQSIPAPNPNMTNMSDIKQFYFRILRLVWGLFLGAFGIAITIHAQIGYAPWEVFHAGIAKATGISIGTVAIISSALLVIITVLVGEKFGLGTIFDMFLMGMFLDLFLGLHIIPTANHLIPGVIMLATGLLIMSLGAYCYIGAGLGTGPRDSLMVALARKTGLPIGLCRGVIEFFAVIAGWSLGGMVGVGTVISAFAVGFFIQIIFKLLKFDATKVNHETFDQTCKIFFFRHKEQIKLKAKEVFESK